jgi:hypothetical protein
MNKALAAATAVAGLVFVTSGCSAFASTLGSIVITPISALYPGAFDNNTADNNPANFGATGLSHVCDSSYCGTIGWATDENIRSGTDGTAATPLGDSTNYIAGQNLFNPWGFQGAEVTFNDYFPTSFNLLWGSIDSLAGDGYDNVLTVYSPIANDTYGVVTGTDLVAALLANGFGSQTNPADNKWFNVSLYDARGALVPVSFFTASSARYAFEFDMASPVPEASTWVMMGLGFAALGYLGLKRSRTSRAMAA